MTRSELLAQLTEIFRENLGDENLALKMKTTGWEIPGCDSAKMVLLILAVEERSASGSAAEKSIRCARSATGLR